MKKKSLKSLILNKKSISDLSSNLNLGGFEDKDTEPTNSLFVCPPPPPPRTFPTYCHTCQYHTYCGPGHCALPG